ncbi:MAG: methylated-DNA--[protein]-cysteine S-methyltransferase [Dehalococcoidia bacterium]
MKNYGPLFYDVFQTSMGWVALVGGEHGILRASLPEKQPEAAMDHVQPEISEAEQSPEAFVDEKALISAYCDGAEVDLGQIAIDTRFVSPFFKQAWEACRSIPAGETRTYRWLAEQAGNVRAARGAGQAMARNKVALLVPCHRVIGSSGKLHGFGGAGLPLKARLLQMEGLRVSS